MTVGFFDDFDTEWLKCLVLSIDAKNIDYIMRDEAILLTYRVFVDLQKSRGYDNDDYWRRIKQQEHKLRQQIAMFDTIKLTPVNAKCDSMVTICCQGKPNVKAKICDKTAFDIVLRTMDTQDDIVATWSDERNCYLASGDIVTK